MIASNDEVICAENVECFATVTIDEVMGRQLGLSIAAEPIRMTLQAALVQATTG